MPEVPTLREAGFNDTEASARFGVVTPARTPRAAIAALNRAINDALRRPTRSTSRVPSARSRCRAARHSAASSRTSARWIPVAKALGVRAE